MSAAGRTSCTAASSSTRMRRSPNGLPAIRSRGLLMENRAARHAQARTAELCASGEVAERLNAPVLKTGGASRPS